MAKKEDLIRVVCIEVGEMSTNARFIFGPNGFSRTEPIELVIGNNYLVEYRMSDLGSFGMAYCVDVYDLDGIMLCNTFARHFITIAELRDRRINNIFKD